jgi:2-phosphoglycerate kinase
MLAAMTPSPRNTRIDPAEPRHASPDHFGRVLLVGGPSGSGKTMLAKALAPELGATWVQVDDLRLALQWSDVRLPTREATDALYFFERTPDVWALPPERLRDALVAVGEVMTEAIAIVAGNHIAQNDPAIIEGDGILPSLVEHPALRPYVDTGHLCAVFLRASSEDALLNAMLARGRGVPDRSTPELRNIARMNWLFAEWLETEAGKRGIPVPPSMPWESLTERVRDNWDMVSPE